MEEESKTLQDYLDIVNRRKFLIMIPFMVIFLASIAVAMVLPASYRSSATISIVRQQIPKDLISSTVTSYADEQIELIKRRIMGSSNIQEIIEKYRLYPDQRDKKSLGELVGEFRANSVFGLVSADITDPKHGRKQKAVIAFTISFMDREPVVAQKVVNELVSLFLSEYARSRTEVTTETAEFLEDESEKAKRTMQEMESQMAEYKQKYSGSMPEMRELNMSRIDRSTKEISEIDRQLQSLEERLVILNIELDKTSPDLLSGDAALTPQAQLSAAQEELARLLRSYTPSHPDVKRLEDQIAALSQEVEQSAAGTKAVKPTNPAYLSIQSQIQFALRDKKNLLDRKIQIQSQIEEFEKLVAQTPQVERGYQNLIRDYDNITKKYQELKAKQLRAEMAQTLEEEQKGESFSLMEPARLPISPEKPNRPKIIMLGLILSLGVGGGAAFLAETMDSNIRGYRAFAEIAGGPPIAVIPYIANQEDIEQKKKILKFMGLAVAIFVLLLILLVHFLFMPLDLIWSKLTG